jgi:hypothetical protein
MVSFPTSSERRSNQDEDMMNDPLWRLERLRLRRGLVVHGALFAIAMAMLFMVNLMTRGDDGSWWVVAVLEVWAVAWSLHAFGVGIASSKRGTPAE